MPNKLVESKMTQLIELLGDMVEKGGVDELDSEPATDFAKECWERFCKIYDDPDFRHSYYTISSSLEKYDPDQRDSLPVYLDRVVDYARMKEDPNSCRILKSVQKLLDHVELECLRINRMDQVKRDADRAERSDKVKSSDRGSQQKIGRTSKRFPRAIHYNSRHFLSRSHRFYVGRFDVHIRLQ